jgi:hypothetical protein
LPVTNDPMVIAASLLCVPKTSRGDDIDFCRRNSLFLRQNSLLRGNNSLFFD